MISASCPDDFSCGVFALRTIVAPVCVPVGAAFVAAQLTVVREQPGRERPHLWTPDPDPRVGSGVAHAPAAGDQSRSENADEDADAFGHENRCACCRGLG